MTDRILVSLYLALIALLPSAARTHSLSTPNMTFEVNSDASFARFVVKGNEAASATDNGEFWRLILDDGMRTEIPVLSNAQKGRVKERGGTLVIEYDSLVSDYGDTYPIDFTVTVEVEDGLFKFTPSMTNRSSEARINECFCPMADFLSISGDKSEDVLYMPEGLGRRDPDPWKMMEAKAPAYYSHDENETFTNLVYPRASMSWFGIESGDRFLYIARYDPDMRQCFLSLRHRIHEDNLTLTVDHFPMARPGESLTEPSTVVGLLDGDWRDGAKVYRKWADANFFSLPERPAWVSEMTGFQRIIMRSQYGLDYYRPEDLPAMYEAGAKYGIHTLFLFAWWKMGMDRGYPYYEEAYPGAFKDLADNIEKVRQMGGRVILECNCHFLDPQVDYYEKFGHEVEIIDINGNPIPKNFVYNGRGEFREKQGGRLFYLACSGTQRWRDQLMSQIRLMGSIGADCLFADCFGFCPYQPCFNDSHEHGNRVDEEWTYHRMFFSDALGYAAGNGRAFATEGATDIAGAYCHFLHGNINADFKISSAAYPQLFCYTFPELVTTERNIYSSEGDFDRQLKNALTMGMRLDAQLWVCRADISRDPVYAEAIGRYTARLCEYGDFFFHGRFTVLDRSSLPYWVKRTEWLSSDGSRILRILYNASSRPVTACGEGLEADEMKFEVFDAADYIARYE